MSKRKCGSCRYFQDSKLAASGWCHHPQRRTTSDILIMVRRNELACRDQWAHDLWVDREASSGGGTPGGMPAEIAPFPVRRLTPASAGEIAAVVQARGSMADEPSRASSRDRPAEDVVLGETLVIGEPDRERDWTSERDDAAASREANTREAIFKAREVHRDRLKTAASKRPIGDAGSAADAAGSHGPPASAGSPTGEGSGVPEGEREAPPVRLPSIESLRPAAAPVARDPFDSVPEVRPGFALPTTPVASARPPVGDASAARGSPDASPDRVDEPESEADRVRHDAAGWRRPVGRIPSIDLRAERPLPSGRATPPNAERRAMPPEPDRLDLPEERDREAREMIDGRRGAFRYRFDRPPVPAAEGVGRSGYEAIDDRDDEPALVTEEMAEEVHVVGAAMPDDVDVGPEPMADAVGPVDDILLPNEAVEDEPAIDLTIRIAPELPRLCRTCRDFRPAEGGDRGWCANEWAFDHRRMVDGGDPMPCETTLGSWWLPADEMWTAKADVSSHGQPTPLMDAIVSHHRDEPMRRRGS